MHAKNWYEHNAEKVTKNDKVKILWDFNIQTDHMIQARWPDIVVKDKELGHTCIVDIAVLGDARVENKEKKWRNIKIWQESYVDYGKHQWMWYLFVVGALGAVAKLEEYLGMIELQQKEVDRIQFSALVGTATILRKVLNVSG